VLCALLHVAALLIGLPALQHLERLLSKSHARRRVSAFLASAVLVLVIVAAHTLLIWIWAASIYATGAFANFATSFYFSTTTYTTLGYADLVLPE